MVVCGHVPVEPILASPCCAHSEVGCELVEPILASLQPLHSCWGEHDLRDLASHQLVEPILAGWWLGRRVGRWQEEPILASQHLAD